MNKTYTSIWNPAFGAWVAAPETAKRATHRKKQRRGTALVLTALVVSGSALAAGGKGGAGDFNNGGMGGDSSTAGQSAGNFNNGSTNPPSSGGAEGKYAGQNGEDAADVTGSTAGGGGGGGASGTAQTAIGGNGGNGGTTTAGGIESYGGGGGGAGGHGYEVNNASVNTIISKGGNGGNGSDGQLGASAGGAGGGGGGGDGGAGLFVDNASGNISITNRASSSLTGGNGGNGGAGNGVALPGKAIGNGGAGGEGGAGLSGTDLVVINAGSITGGNGGIGGSSTDAAAGIAGAGGAGINGVTHLINSGSIVGGMAGNGSTRANAVAFSGSNNTLELRAGSVMVGNVVATAGGSNELTLGGTDNSQFNLSTIGMQYQNFSHFSKTGSSTWTVLGTQTVAGDWSIEAGTLQAGAANVFNSSSAHAVSSGAVLDLAGHNQTLAGVNNSGSIRLSGTVPGTVLTVTGPYVGNNGTLALSTVLGADGSVTDKILLSSPLAVASGHTSLQITNAGGLGAQTTGSGIEVVGTEKGASLQPGSFTLAGGHVDAGAYEYRLTQTAQGAALHSSLHAPAYRAEVPLLSALPAQLRQADMAMLGDLHKRMGDKASQLNPSTGIDQSRRVWGRVLRTDPTIRQQGTVSPESSGHMSGFQAGLDLYADKNVKVGIYVGQLEGDMSVKGFASGVERKYVGFNNLRTRYLGIYGTWQDASGLYADAVLQGADYRSDSRTADDKAQSRTKGEGWLASLELGKPFAINNSWQVEPQAQIIYRKLSIDDTALSLASVKNKADDDWTLRLGARIKGSFNTGAGLVQPYGRINIYKASSTTDMATFITPAASSDINAKGGYTATELAAGATLQLSNNTSLYSELGKIWANGGDSRVKSGVQASVGVKVLW
ncbi:autotransporter outer membrane beta-barrel domain-containing protein [Comamonas sp. Y33R10-2]|uniref:autotransporter outer membrane beta-barrel domain-containing protein n=1 Tax=Comamonas sp. Y33R10-2 TaxID=2853257 RepID=UPI001C5CA594|nr:autotransporter outer membrane beta-barrel domain-containing protein [Comamonas sp. Y33R10-2]QXZ10249.1 autotransporter outer membrane beta-barrel domain-containing protein [Comamonas sp. Y33R10-2]